MDTPEPTVPNEQIEHDEQIDSAEQIAPPEPAIPPTPLTTGQIPRADSIRSSRRWRSRHWKAFSGVMAMVTALAVVWGVLSSFTIRQREADLQAAISELNDLRDRLRSIEPHRPSDRSVEDMLEEILSLPDPENL